MTQLVYKSAFTVTESDTVPLPGGPCQAIRNDSAVAADIRVRLADNGQVFTFVSVPAGAIVPVVCTHIFATGTGADSVSVLN